MRQKHVIQGEIFLSDISEPKIKSVLSGTRYLGLNQDIGYIEQDEKTI